MKLFLAALSIAAFSVAPAAMAVPITPASGPASWQYNFTGLDGETGTLVLNGINSQNNPGANGGNANEVSNIGFGELILNGGSTNVCPAGSPHCVSGLPFSTGTFYLDQAASFSNPSSNSGHLDFENLTDTSESLVFDVADPNVSSLEIQYTHNISKNLTTIDLIESGNGYTNNNDPINVTLPPGPSSYAPEPSSLALLGTGLLGLAFLLFRRNRPSQKKSIA